MVLGALFCYFKRKNNQKVKGRKSTIELFKLQIFVNVLANVSHSQLGWERWPVLQPLGVKHKIGHCPSVIQFLSHNNLERAKQHNPHFVKWGNNELKEFVHGHQSDSVSVTGPDQIPLGGTFRGWGRR